MNYPAAAERPAPRQRVAGETWVDVTYSAVAGELVVTTHIHVGHEFVVPTRLETEVAHAVDSILRAL
jgi:hypothetical protein